MKEKNLYRPSSSALWCFQSGLSFVTALLSVCDMPYASLGQLGHLGNEQDC